VSQAEDASQIYEKLNIQAKQMQDAINHLTDLIQGGSAFAGMKLLEFFSEICDL